MGPPPTICWRKEKHWVGSTGTVGWDKGNHGLGPGIMGGARAPIGWTNGNHGLGTRSHGGQGRETTDWARGPRTPWVRLPFGYHELGPGKYVRVFPCKVEKMSLHRIRFWLYAHTFCIDTRENPHVYEEHFAGMQAMLCAYTEKQMSVCV